MDNKATLDCVKDFMLAVKDFTFLPYSIFSIYTFVNTEERTPDVFGDWHTYANFKEAAKLVGAEIVVDEDNDSVYFVYDGIMFSTYKHMYKDSKEE